MSSQWKQHSGARRNRNVKATSVLFEKSNFWQRGPNLELYHDNDGSTSYVGIGTATPMSRLSFGDVSASRRLAYANNGNFAICEKSDGSEATGIGFYERYKQNNLNDTRLFTGIKFVVNKDNNNTMDMSGSNIKMLLRDDGKLLVGHDPDESTALEPYNVAMLDVSGNIRTSNFLILNRIDTVRSYKPPGSIRYNGSRLIYTDDENKDFIISVESDVAKTGDWLSGVDELGNTTVYLNNIPVGIIRNLYDQDLFEAEFQVEGRVCVSDQQFMKIPVYSKTTIFDASGDGIVVAQHNLAVGTHECKALLDLNYLNKPFIKAGNDTVDISWNDVGIGQTIELKSRYDFAMGSNHTVIGTTEPDGYHFCMGTDHKIIDGTRSTTFGKGHIIHNSLSSSSNTAFGINNKIFDCSGGFIAGRDSTLGHISADPIYNPENSAAFGQENFILAQNSFTAGYKNVLAAGKWNASFGYNNDISNSQLIFNAGGANIIKDSSACSVFGHNNSAISNTIGSLLSGTSQLDTNGNYNSFFGNNQTANTTNNTILGGQDNNSTSLTNSFIFGKSNTGLTTNESFITGTSNNISNTTNTLINGELNTVQTNTDNTIISGKSNTVSTGNYNAHFGELNQSTNTNNSISSGKSNTITNVNTSGIVGIDNTISNSDYSLVQGKNNTIQDSSGTILMGLNNQSNTNSKNNIAVGSNNTVSGGNNNALFGNSLSTNTTDGSIISGNTNIANNATNSSIFGSNNTIQTTHNSNISGKHNVTKDIFETTVFGTSNDASNNTTNSMIVGKNNRDYSGNTVTTLGNSNYTTDSKNSLITGESNQTIDVSASFILGTNNTVENNDNSIIAGKGNILRNNTETYAFGINNDLSSCMTAFAIGSNNMAYETDDSLIVGEGNDGENGFRTVMVGQTNKMLGSIATGMIGKNNNDTSTQEGLIVGLNNVTNNSHKSLIQGEGNNVTQTTNSLISGKNNTDSTGNASMVIGDSNNTSQNINTIIGGKSNTVQLSNYSNVKGKSNTVSGNNTVTVFGDSNKVRNNTSVLVNGLDNDVSGNTIQSIVSGFKNMENNGKNNAIFGREQFVSTSENILLDGSKNTVTSTYNSIVSGNINNVTTTHESIVSGVSNSTKGIKGSLVSGLNNDVSNNVTNTLVMGKGNKVYNTNDVMTDNISSIYIGNDHTITNTKTSLSTGENHIISSSTNFVSLGNSNQSSNDVNTVTMGNLNNVSQNTNTLISGKSNIVSDTNQTTVLGEGNNQIQFSTNSLIIGKNNKENNSNQTVVTGEDNNSVNNNNSFIGGNNNTTNTNSSSIIYGNLNTNVNNNTSITVGASNTIRDVVNISVVGNNNDVSGNTIRTYVLGKTNKINNTDGNIISGEQNDLKNSKNGITIGFKNKEYNSEKNAIFGDNHDISNNNNSIVSGQSNELKDSNYNSVFGSNNVVNINTTNSLIMGESNSSATNKNTIMFGESNISSTNENTLLTGKNNTTVTDNKNSILNGLSNNSQTNNQSLISGNLLTATSNNNTLVNGLSNNVSNSSQSLVSGLLNVENTGKNNAIFGREQSVLNSENILLDGSKNTVSTTYNSIVSGHINNVTTTHESIVSGVSNSTKSIKGSLVSGSNNDVSNNVTNTLVMGKGNKVYNTNQAMTDNVSSIYIGNDHTITESLTTIASGENNTITSSNGSSIFGHNISVDTETDTIIAGKDHTVKNSTYNAIFGNNNDLISNTTGTIMAGSDNKETAGTNNAIFGKNQKSLLNNKQVLLSGINHSVQNTENSIITGETNVATASLKSYIGGVSNSGISLINSNLTGDDNSTVNVINTLMAGKDNSLQAGNNSIVNGKSNTISVLNESIVSGDTNIVTTSNRNEILGKDINVDNCEDSIIIGNAHDIDDISRCAVFGDTNTVSGLTVNSVIGGKNNIEGTKSGNNMTSGALNEINDSSNNMTSGVFNRMTDVSGGIVGGHNNQLTNLENSLIIGKDSVVSDSKRVLVYGSGHQVIKSTLKDATRNSLIGGRANIDSGGNSNTVFGFNNNLTDVSNVLVNGTNNVLSTDSQSIILGDSNTSISTVNGITIGKNNATKNITTSVVSGTSLDVSVNTVNSIVIGNLNKETTGINNATFGMSNTGITNTNTIVSGKNNVNTSNTESGIIGTSNQTNSNVNSLLVGNSNTISNNSQVIVTGSNHTTVTNNSDTIVSGLNNISKTNKNSLLIGTQQNTDTNENILVGGNLNTVKTTDDTIISGKQNIIENVKESSIIGSNNDVSGNTQYSMTIGQSNKNFNNKHALLSGKSNIVKDTTTTTVLGESNDVSGNTTQSLVVGLTNNNNNNQYNVTYGKLNTTKDSKGSLIGGENHTAKSVTNGVSFGNNNKLENVSNSMTLGELNDISGNTNNTLISGKKNYENNGNNNTILGNEEVVKNSTNVLVSGKNNSLTNDIESIVIGLSNTLTDSEKSGVIGESNTIINATKNSVVFGKSNQESNGNNNIVTGTTNQNTSGTNNLITGSNNNVSSATDTVIFGKSNTITNGNNNMVSGLSQIVTDSSNNMIEGITNKLVKVGNSAVYGKSQDISGSYNVLTSGLENKLELANNSVAIGYKNDISNSLISCAIGEENTIKKSSLASIALGKLNTIDEVNHGIALGYKATVSGDTRLAIGSEEIDGNIMTINKYGDMFLGRHLFSDADEDKNIFTDLLTSKISIGGHNSKTYVGGTLEVSGNIIAGVDEDKNIFTDVSTNRIKIGGVSSTVIVGGDLRVNTNILSEEGSADEDKEIWTDVITKNIYMGGNQSTVWLGKDLQVANDIVLQGNLTVKGATTRIHTTNMDISDNVILLNKGIGQNANANFSSGFTILRSTDNKFIGWDEALDSFILASTTYDGTGESVTMGTKSKLMIDNLETDVDIKIGGNITTTETEDKTIWADILDHFITIGSGQSKVKFDSTNATILPKGTSVERIYDELGAIRYNTTLKNFEACVKINATTPPTPAAWRLLGGVIDIDQDTYISAEDDHQTDNDQLKFVTAGSERMIILNNGNIGIKTPTPNITLEIHGTDAMKIPCGTNDQGLGIASNADHAGMLRYNTTQKRFEGFTMKDAEWVWDALTPGGAKTDSSGNVIVGASVVGNSLFLYSNTKKQMVLRQDGNFGFGTKVNTTSEYNPRVIVDISSNDAIRIPVGTNAERPATSGTGLPNWQTRGYTRYNTQYDQFEGWDGTVWRSLTNLVDDDRDTYIKVASDKDQDEDTIAFYVGQGLNYSKAKKVMLINQNNIHIGKLADVTPNDPLNNDNTYEHPIQEQIKFDVNNGNIDTSGNIRLFQNILSHTDTDKTLWGDIALNKVIIGGNKSTTRIQGTLDVSGNITATDADEDKGIFLNSQSVNIEIGSSQSTVKIGNNLKVKEDITSYTDEDKNIYVDVTEDINIGGATSNVVVGGNLKIKDKIESVDDGVDKEIFTGIDNTIKIGSGDSTTFVQGFLQIKEDIKTTNNSGKKLFVKQADNQTDYSGKITMGGANSTILMGGTLEVTDKIDAPDTSVVKEIYTNTDENVVIGSNGGHVVIGNNIRVKEQILSVTDKNKEIYPLVGQTTQKTITIGGVKSKTVINNDLQVNNDIVSDDTSEDKNIYVTSTGKINIGNQGGSIVMKGDLQINENIVADVTTENKSIFGTTTGEVTLGSSTSSTIKIANDLSVVNKIIAPAAQNTAKEIFTDVLDKDITIGGQLGKVVAGNDLESTRDIIVKRNAIIHEHITTDAEEDKEIFKNVGNNNITMGGSTSTVVIAGTLQPNGHITAKDNNSGKEIFTNLKSYNIQIGSSEQPDAQGQGGATNSVIIGNHLQVNNNIKSGSDENKTIFGDIVSQTISIGGKKLVPQNQTSDGSIIKFDTTNSIILPIGKNNQRSSTLGALRYNSDNVVFEGYDGTSWVNLGGVMDVDKDTFISAESSPTADEDRLLFVTAGTDRAIIKSDGKMGIGTITPDADCLVHIKNGALKTEDVKMNSIAANENTYITLKNDIIPEHTNTISLGTPAKKIKELFVGNNSIWVGDKHKLGVSSDGEMKIRKRKIDDLPASIVTAYRANHGAGTDIATIESDVLNSFVPAKTNLNQVTIDNYVTYVRGKGWGGIYDVATAETIFRDNVDDYSEEMVVSMWKNNSNNETYSDRYVGIGVVDPTEQLHIGGNIMVDNNILGSNIDKQLFTDALDKSVTIGGASSTVITGGDLQVNTNILAGVDEDKTIFADVTNNNITVGGATSTVIMGGDLQVNTNILAGVDEHKTIFADVATNNITIGGNKSSTIIKGTLDISGNITAPDDENKEIFTSVNKDITVGGATSKIIMGGDLQVNTNILAGADEDKTIFTDVTNNNITVGGATSKVIMGGDLQVNTNILAGVDEDKTIFADVDTNNITIGGNKSTTIIQGTLDVSGNITAPDDENKEIFTSVNKDITVGGATSKIIMGGDLQVNTNILAGVDEDKTIFADVASSNITVGGATSNVITGGDLRVTKDIYSDTADIAKTIFSNVNAEISLGGVNSVTKASGDLKIFKNILSSTDVAKTIFTSVNNDITVGGATSKVIMGGDLQVNTNILSGIDEDKTIFADITSKTITIGGKTEDSTTNPGTENGGSIIKLDSTNSMIIPIGNNNQRTDNIGAVRFNSELTQFEGYSGVSWIGLKATMDIDGDTRIDAPGTDDDYLSFITDGSEKMRLITNGNLGIGLNTPQQKLHVNGNIYLGPDNDQKQSQLIHCGGDLGVQSNESIKIVSDVENTGGAVGETITHTITVSNDKFVVDGTSQDTLSFIRGNTYILNQEDSTNQTHPIRLSTTSDGKHNATPGTEYLTGVTKVGTAGNTAASLIIAVALDAPTTLYYYSDGSTANMGGQIDLSNPPPSDIIFGYGSAIDTNTTRNFTETQLGTFPRVETMRIVSKTGNVGIGTSNPTTKLDVDGNLIVRGDFTVKGQTTTINTTNLDISDNVLIMNKGLGSAQNANASSGILIQRHANNQFMGWDETENSFIFGETTDDGSIATDGAVTIADKSSIKAKSVDLTNDLTVANITASGSISSDSLSTKTVTTETITATGIPGTTTTHIVTVQSNSFYVDGQQRPGLTFVRGNTYIFDLDDSSVANHPLNMATVSNGIHTTPDTGDTPITSESIVKMVDNNGTNSYTFNDSNTYETAWSLKKGTYIFKNIPSGHPMAILNIGKTDRISYTGDVNNKTTKNISGTTADGDYDFYHGDITVTVNDDFGTVSVYCEIHGYMGGENLLKYNTFNTVNYTDGVTITGNPGQATPATGDQLQIVVSETTPNTLYYYDPNTSGNTGAITINDAPMAASFKDISANTMKVSGKITANTIEFTGSGAITFNDVAATNINATSLNAQNSITLNNPEAGKPKFDLMDLVGPPKAIAINSTANTAVHFDAVIQPIVRYAVGFTPDKLPMIVKLNVLLTQDSNNNQLVSHSLTSSDINNFEALDTIRFSKQSNTNSFAGGVYTFYNLSTLTDTESYTLKISFENYHPTLNETSQSALTLTSAVPPELINTITIVIPINTNGSGSTTNYLISNNPQISIQWNEPVANSGDIDKYYIQYETTATLNGATAGSDTVTVGPQSASSLTKSLSDGIKFSSKYKFRVKAGNDAGALADYGNWVETDYYTTAPSKPSVVRIDNEDLTPDVISSSEQFDIIDMYSGNGGGASTDGIYSSYNSGTQNWTQYNVSNRQLLRQTNFDNGNYLSLWNITDIHCNDTLNATPTLAGPYTFKAEIINDTNSNVVSTNTVTFTSITNRVNDQIQSDNGSDIKLSVNVKDKYSSASDVTSNKSGNWLTANFTNTQFKIPSNTPFGTMKVTTDVPYITNNSQKVCSYPYATDTLDSNPTLSNNNGNTKWIGVSQNAAVTFICGIGSLNTGATMDIQFNIDNLASSSSGYYRGDYLQAQLYSSITDAFEVKGNNATYGISSTENSGNSIAYNAFTSASTIRNVSALGDLVDFTIEAYNLNGKTTVVKQARIINDVNSKNNTLHTTKRWKTQTWSGALAHDNLPATGFDGAGNKFDDNIALESNEMLTWNGNLTTDATRYNHDYRALYNQNISGTEITNKSLTYGIGSGGTAAWSNGNWKWALFKLTNTVQVAGTASFGIKFTTPSDSPFTVGSGKESQDFECNILLSSTLNGGTPYWYNVNKDYESENTKSAGTGANGVTGLGIFDSKTRTTGYTIFKVTPPVPTTGQAVSDMWIRVGFGHGATIKISNIELVTV